MDNEGYLVDDELKTVYIRGRGYHRDRMGEHAHHSPDPDLEEVRGRQRHQRLPAGTPLEGAVFEIYNKANALVDTIESNSRGLAVSKPLPLGRYIVKEVSSPQYYSVSEKK